MNYLWMTLIATFIFVIIDAIWLGLIAPKFYQKNIGHLLAEKPNFTAAIIFYVVYILGIGYIVIWPAITNEQLGGAFISGAVFGLVAYATYDLTNLATLHKWPIKVTLIDLLWGTSLSSVISGVTYLIYQMLF